MAQAGTPQMTFSAPYASAGTGRETALMKEIRAQAGSIRDTLRGQRAQVTAFARYLEKHKAANVPVLACGSSMHAFRIAEGELPPGIFRLADQPIAYAGIPEAALFISQSGNSGDLAAPFERLVRDGCYTVAITNTPDSALGRGARLVIPTFAMPEKSIAATNTMTSAVATLLHLSAVLRGDSQALAELFRLPDAVHAFIGNIGQTTFGIVASELAKARYIFFLGERGLAHAASEAALKVRETAEILAESNSASGAMHGFLSAFGSRVPEVAAMPKAIVLFAEQQDGALANRYSAFARQHNASLHVIACSEGCEFGYAMRIPASTRAEKLVLPLVFTHMLVHDMAVRFGIEPGTSEIDTKVVR